jgi:hypothetical protein
MQWVQNFADWWVSYAQEYTVPVACVALTIAIALVSSASFLKDRTVDAVARIVFAVVAGFAAWAVYFEHWNVVHTTTVWLTYAACVAAIGFVALTAVKLARSFEAPPSKDLPADPTGDQTDAELAELVRAYKADHPAEWASIEAQTRRQH